MKVYGQHISFPNAVVRIDGVNCPNVQVIDGGLQATMPPCHWRHHSKIEVVANGCVAFAPREYIYDSPVIHPSPSVEVCAAIVFFFATRC